MNWIVNWIGPGEPAESKYYYVDFDGDSSYIDCGADASLEDLHGWAGFTADGWLYVPDRQLEGYGTIVSKYDIVAAAPTGWYFAVDQGSGVLAASAIYSTTPAASVTIEWVTPGTWAHVLACYNPVDAKLYMAINGVWCTYLSQQAAVGVIGTDVGIDFLMAADHANGNPIDFLAGGLQWVRINTGVFYEIGVNFTPPDMCPPPDPDPNIVELWALDEGAGISTAATMNAPTNNGAMTDCTWYECEED